MQKYKKEIKEQKVNKSITYPNASVAKELPPYITRTHIALPPPRTTAYYLSYHPTSSHRQSKAMTPKRDKMSVVNQTRSFMDDDDDSSSAFQEFLDEIKKVEGKKDI